MSFILDALRKSEHDRQRQTGPALVEAPVVAPRPRPNRWATAAIALLLVNLVAIGVLLLVKSGDTPPSPPSAASAPATQQATPPASAASAGPAPAANPAAQASVTRTLPEPSLPAPPPPVQRSSVPPAAGGTRGSLEQEMSGYAQPIAAEMAVAAATPPPGPAAVAPARRGSVVYQALPEADPAATYAPPPRSATAGLPRADDMTARGSLPELRLELHVWSTKPQERFVFVNGRRYREGDTLSEGGTIEEVTREGVIVNSGGNRFLLSRD